MFEKIAKSNIHSNNTMSRKTILLATRPLVPPWDEASKNFAYFLAKSITKHQVTVFTTPTPLPDLPGNVIQDPRYTGAHLDSIKSFDS